MSKLECWTRERSNNSRYVVCSDSKGQKKISNNNMVKEKKKPPVPKVRQGRGKNRNPPIIQDAIDSYKFDIIPMMDISRGSTQRRVEQQDRREQFLQRDRRKRFVDMTERGDRDSRRRAFSRTLSNPQQFMGKTYKAPQEVVNPRYVKRFEKVKKQVAEGNYKSKQAEYRAKRQLQSLTEYMDLDTKRKQAKTPDEYTSLSQAMESGEFMKWERYNTLKNKKQREKKSMYDV
jgi:hypothetical protein